MQTLKMTWKAEIGGPMAGVNFGGLIRRAQEQSHNF